MVPNQIEWDALHYPQTDDVLGLARLYPNVQRPRTQNLVLNLLHSPGGGDWQESTFPAEVAAGGEMVVGMYLLENAGAIDAKQPLIDWYLAKGRNWNDRFYYLGRSNYDTLPAGEFFYTTEDLNVKLKVPDDVEPGEYYLGGYLRDDPEFGDSAFPFNSNSTFSRTRITVKAGPLPPGP
jgi:hypothetical protein